MFTLKRTYIQRTPLLNGCGHQNEAILLQETCIKQTLQDNKCFQKVFLRHHGIAICFKERIFPNDLVILPETTSYKRFAIKHVKYSGK